MATRPLRWWAARSSGSDGLPECRGYLRRTWGTVTLYPGLEGWQHEQTEEETPPARPAYYQTDAGAHTGHAKNVLKALLATPPRTDWRHRRTTG